MIRIHTYCMYQSIILITEMLRRAEVSRLTEISCNLSCILNRSDSPEPHRHLHVDLNLSIEESSCKSFRKQSRNLLLHFRSSRLQHNNVKDKLRFLTERAHRLDTSTVPQYLSVHRQLLERQQKLMTQLNDFGHYGYRRAWTCIYFQHFNM
jgi:hypothetical protein